MPQSTPLSTTIKEKISKNKKRNSKMAARGRKEKACLLK
jgi:hypothetical protein